MININSNNKKLLILTNNNQYEELLRAKNSMLVTFTHKVQQAQQALNETKFDLIIIDDSFEMTASEIITLIREHPLQKLTPILLVVAIDNDKEFVKCSYIIDASIDYILKPFTMSYLNYKIEFLTSLYIASPAPANQPVSKTFQIENRLKKITRVLNNALQKG